MRHAGALRRLSEYLDGTLPSRDGKRVEAHLAGCVACRKELAELRRTTELLRGLRHGEDAPDLTAAVLERIRSGEGDPSASDRVRAAAVRFLSGAWGAPLATAAVGLAVLAIVPRVEIEVSIPGGAAREVVVPVARAPAPQRRAPPPAARDRRRF